MENEELAKKCPTCGASIAISPEDIIITCKYCGATFDLEGKKVPNHRMLPTLPEKAIKNITIKFLQRNRGITRSLHKKAVIEEVKLNYIPYWVCPFSSNTHYYGVRQSTETSTITVRYGKGQKYKTRERVFYRPVTDDFARSGRENVIARKHTMFYGFDNFQKKLNLEKIEEFDFDKIKSLNAEFINAEVNPVEASREAYGRVEDENRIIAGSKVDELVRCDSKIEMYNPIYVHAPLWQVRYKFKNKIYKVSIIGDSGTVLKGEIPLTFGRRAANYLTGMLFLLTGAYVGQIGVGFPSAYDSLIKILYIYLIGSVGPISIGNETIYPASFAFQAINSSPSLLPFYLFEFVVIVLSFIFMRTAFKTQLEKDELKGIKRIVRDWTEGKREVEEMVEKVVRKVKTSGNILSKLRRGSKGS